mmetsp:Transcript_40092/g.64432  ORF Transcript_40092/g.64432 Transcript_40092/m.64432 type:complete len:298 (+) Transcript_40092:436-1329(+)
MLVMQALAHIGQLEQAATVSKIYEKCRAETPRILKEFVANNGLSTRALAAIRIAGAHIFMEMGDPESSYDLLLKASKVHPLPFGALKLFHKIVELLGYPKKCQGFLQRQLEKYTESPEAAGYFVLNGHVHLSKGKFGDAIDAYDQAASLFPKNSFMPVLQGSVVLQQGMATSGSVRHALIFRAMSFFLHEYNEAAEAYYKAVQGKVDSKIRGDHGSCAKKLRMTIALYNLARGFHYLALNHLSFQFYEQVLQLQNHMLSHGDICGFTCDAAYNIMTILQDSGAWEIARRLSMEYIKI